MLYKDLQARRPGVDAELLADYDALYTGGKAFRTRLSRFLPQNNNEPSDHYQARCREAHYRNYLGPIVDFFAAHLFSAPFEVRSKRDGELVDADPFYAQFREDCDANDTDFVDFLRGRFVEALIKGRAYWLVEMPDDGGTPPGDKAEWQARKLGDGYVRAVPTEEVLDWECDESGALLWAIVHERETARVDWRLPRNIITETWHVFDAEYVETFEVTYDPARPPTAETDIGSTGRRPHNCNVVPLICLDIDPDGLWAANRIASPQIEHFRLSNANAWSIRRTCYAMPVLKVMDPKQPPAMGAGYYIMIGTGEEFGWSSPPSVPYQAMSAEVASLKDEIFRIANNMALGVDNNAAAIGRSGDSKLADARATEVVLTAYGSLIRGAAEETYEVLSDARGDTDITWSVEGLQSFNVGDAVVLIEAATQAEVLGIPSETYQREVKTKIALSMVNDISQDVKDTIRKEIEAGVEAEVKLADEMKQASAVGAAAMNALGAAPAQGGQAPPGQDPLTKLVSKSTNAQASAEVDAALA